MPYSAKEYVQAFQMHRASLLELLAQIPEDKTTFAPWEGAKNFVELSNHINASNVRILAMMAGEKPVSPEPASDLAGARVALESSATNFTKAVLQLSNEQLETVVEAFGGMKLPVYKLLDFAREHEAHHKGQVWTMARMVGVQPPMFVKFG